MVELGDGWEHHHASKETVSLFGRLSYVGTYI